MAEDNSNNGSRNNGPYVPGGAQTAFGPSSGAADTGQALSPDAMDLVVQSMREMGYKLSESVSGSVSEQVRSILESTSGTRYITARLRGMANVINKMPVGDERQQATQQYQELTSAVGQLAPGVTAPLYTAQGQSQYQLQQAVQQTVTSNEEEYRKSYLQASRNTLRSGGNLTDAELKQVETYANQLREQANTLRDKVSSYEEPKNDQEKGEQIRVRNEFAQVSSEASSFEQTLEEGLRQQSQDNQKLLGFVGSVVSSLALGQLANQFLIRDPLRFETAPALAAAGRTSEIGQIVSQAMMTAEEYSANLNSQALSSGFVLGGLGVSNITQGAFTPGKTASGRAMRQGLMRSGAGGLALGGIIGATGVAGIADDIIQGLPGTFDDEDIMGAEIAREVLNAPRLAEFYQTSRAGLLQRSGDVTDLGFTQGAAGGNNILYDMVTQQTTSGMTLEDLGYGTTDAGRLLSMASLSMRGSGTDLDQAVQLAGNMQVLYGMGEEQTLSSLASLQRAGTAPGETADVFMSSMGVVADDQGELSNFAANVLVPALNQVLESTSIRNVSRTNEELQRDVFGFRQALEGDDVLGRRLESSPEVFNTIFQDTQSAVQQATSNPGLMAYFRSLGASFTEIYSGSPRVGIAALNDFVRSGRMSGRLDSDTSMEELLAIIGPFSENLLPYKPQVAASLVRRMLQGETFDTQADLDVAAELAEKNLETRAGNLPEDLTELLSEMATSNIRLNEQMNNSIDSLIQMQKTVQDFVTDGGFEGLLLEGQDRLMEEFYRQMGRDDIAKMYGKERQTRIGLGDILGYTPLQRDNLFKESEAIADFLGLPGQNLYDRELRNLFIDLAVRNPDALDAVFTAAKDFIIDDTERQNLLNNSEPLKMIIEDNNANQNSTSSPSTDNNTSSAIPGGTTTTSAITNPGAQANAANISAVVGLVGAEISGTGSLA